MAGVFSKPKRPRIPQAPEAPNDNAAKKKSNAAAKKRRQAVQQRGRQSTILSNATGGFSSDFQTKKVNLGGEG